MGFNNQEMVALSGRTCSGALPHRREVLYLLLLQYHAGVMLLSRLLIGHIIMGYKKELNEFFLSLNTNAFLSSIFSFSLSFFPSFYSVVHSGYWGPGPGPETTFSNEYFRLLLEESWTIKTTHEVRG
jgi:hypothetical protein